MIFYFSICVDDFSINKKEVAFLSCQEKKKGLFITLEGIDGCGKTLMSQYLVAWCQENNYDLLLTREPGGSFLGKKLREILLENRQISLDSKTEALLFAADRACHCREVIMPALCEGKIVICDRYMDSTLAYQGGGRGLDLDFLQALNDFAGDQLYPDLTFYLHLDWQQSLDRRDSQKDKMEEEDYHFYSRIMDIYDQIAANDQERVKIIDASLEPRLVFEQIIVYLQGMLPFANLEI
ncbi:MAG: dTMP kinase [Clostridiales bacterium]